MAMETSTVSGTLPNRRELMEKLDRLTMPADVKRILAQLAVAVVEVGGKLVEAGRRIVAFLLDAMRSFPNTAMGIVVALTVSMLVASVPFLGALLAPLLTPILLAFGLTRGMLADMKDNGLRRRIEGLEAEFRGLAA